MASHRVNLQVIYPNVLGFWGFAFLDMDPELPSLASKPSTITR